MLELITGPMTGQQYLDSLQDGREVYIYGERVKDVVTHRAFRNAARSIARLYDALHDRAALRNARCVTTSFTRSDRKSTRLNSSHQIISYAVLCVKKKIGRGTRAAGSAGFVGARKATHRAVA